MTSNIGLLYRRFFDAYKKKYPGLPALTAAAEATEEWKRAKDEHPHDFEDFINERIDEYLFDVSRKRIMPAKPGKAPMTMREQVLSDPRPCTSFGGTIPIEEYLEVSAGSATEEDKCSSDDDANGHGGRKYSKPSQETSRKRIHDLETELIHLTEARNNQVGDEYDIQIKRIRQEIDDERRALSKKERNAQRQRKFRETFKTKIKAACAENPQIAEKLKTRDGPGRPRLDENQPELVKTLVDIAMSGRTNNDQQSNDRLKSTKTLDSLHQELLKAGFSISRSATHRYLRLLPQTTQNREEKRHMTTDPVVLRQGMVHYPHPDADFCATSIEYLECLASVLGPWEVFFLCQDHKARVPIGMTTARKLAPLLVRMEYDTFLPDSAWMAAESRKLVPSVYAGIIINEQGMGNQEALTHIGPTYIAIRHGDQYTHSAYGHAADLETLVNLESFHSIAKNEHGAVKPVMIMTVYGGPDESPRDPKTIAFAIKHFREFNLDALFIVADAPGQSALNRAERRLAVLSKQLSDVIIPHNRCGSHLDTDGQTLDKELEKESFTNAGEILAEVWSSLVLDGHTVTAEYAHPKMVKPPLPEQAVWYSKHVRESQYLLQIVKCDSPACCGMLRSSLRSILPDGFLPPPCTLMQSPSGLTASQPCSVARFAPFFVRNSLRINPSIKCFALTPYDFFCPSVLNDLPERTCCACGLYHASNKSAAFHREQVHGMRTAPWSKVQPSHVAARRDNELLCIIRDEVTGGDHIEWIPEEEVDMDLKVDDLNRSYSVVPIVNSSTEWVLSPWVTCV